MKKLLLSVLTIVFAAVMSLSFFGCAEAGSGSEPEVDESGNTIVKVMVHVAEQSAEGKAYKRVTDNFNSSDTAKENSIRVRVEYKPRSTSATGYETELIAMMNQFSAWKDIASSYKVILLPFPYAVSAEAAAKLREAAESGVRIIALGGCGEGPVDELGEPHKGGPALRDLVADGKITVFPIDVIGTRNSAELEESFRKVLSEALAARNGPSLTLRRPGRHDVQCYMLEKSPAEKLVLLVNYCERDTAVDLGVKVPPGTWRMEICGLEDTARGRIGGKTEFTDEALKNFRVDLSRDEIMMLRIHQTGKQ